MSFLIGWPNLHTQKELAGALKYVGILITTGLSVYSLRKQTVVKSDDPLKPNKFTPAGKVYLVVLLTATCLTILTSIWENRISNSIEKQAKEAGYQELLTMLDPKFTEVKNGLNDFQKVMATATTHLRITERDLSYSNLPIFGFSVSMYTSEVKKHSLRIHPALVEELHNDVEKECLGWGAFGVTSGNPPTTCIFAGYQFGKVQYGVPLAYDLGATKSTNIVIDLTLRNASVHGTTNICGNRDHSYSCMSFSIRYPDPKGTDFMSRGDEVGILKQPGWSRAIGFVPEPQRHAEKGLATGFIVSGLRRKDTEKMYGRDTDLISLSISVCGTPAPVQKQWDVTIENWSQFTFEKDYHLYLTEEHFEHNCSVRRYEF